MHFSFSLALVLVLNFVYVCICVFSNRAGQTQNHKIMLHNQTVLRKAGTLSAVSVLPRWAQKARDGNHDTRQFSSSVHHSGHAPWTWSIFQHSVLLKGWGGDTTSCHMIKMTRFHACTAKKKLELRSSVCLFVVLWLDGLRRRAMLGNQCKKRDRFPINFFPLQLP